MPSNGKGIGLTATSLGALLIYGGLKGYSPLKAVQNIIQGKPGNTGQTSASLTATGGTNSVASSGMPVQGSYDHNGLMQLWMANGGSSGAANNAACHAIQESTGNPRATSANPDGGTNVGLWQLDTLGKGAGHSIAELQDPNTNARITVQATGNGRDWSAWSTPGC